MQQCLPVELRGPQLEQRPPVGRQHLMRHPLADRVHELLRIGGRPRRFRCSISYCGTCGKNLLQSVVADHRSQHFVTFDQRPPGGLHLFPVQIGDVELQVDVAGDFAQLEETAAPQPIAPAARRSAGTGRAETRYPLRADRPGARASVGSPVRSVELRARFGCSLRSFRPGRGVSPLRRGLWRVRSCRPGATAPRCTPPAS